MRTQHEPTIDVPDASPFEGADGSSSLPRRVGRFVLERELGAGGMGTVYDGWDAQLQRRVALKFMRSFEGGPVAEQRMFREAQGLAALSHPNVVPVYDVGRDAERVWIAMEHVPGRTLRAWANEAPRARAELLDRWLAAGRGLAAIHAAGLIHRDIKPDNILLGDDGRVRIIDFGLVRGAEDLDERESLQGLTDSGSSESLTSTGDFIGTPAYASPEQHERGRVDARSDQYSYCVSLWEALCGERPPRRQRGRGGLVPLPERRRLPKRLHRVLSRGLALDREARFPDMHGLIAALTPRRRRWAAVSALGSVTLSVATIVGVLATRSPSVDPGLACIDAELGIERSWSASERDSFAAKLEPEERGFGLAAVDAWAEDWRAAAAQNCRRFHVEGRYEAETFGRGEQCLDRRLAEFEALVDLGVAGQLAGPGRLVAELGQLGDPGECLDAAIEADRSPIAPRERLDEIARIRRILAAAAARNASASVSERLESIAALEPEIEAIGWTPLIGEATLVAGGLEIIRGDSKAALAQLGRALDIGESNRDTELAADAWTGIIRVNRELEFDAGRVRWALERREAVLARHGASAQQRARLEAERGLLLRMEGRFAEAEAALRNADASFARAGASAAWERAAALRDLGNLLTLLGGRRDEARELFERARSLELAGAERDEQAPSPIARFNEAVTELEAGDLDAALRLLDEALELGIRSHGPRSPVVVNVLVAKAKIHDQRGELDRARVHAELADRASAVAFGAEHPSRGDVLSALGTIAYREGRAAEAAAAFERALTIAERAPVPDPLTLGMSASNLADARHMLGDDRRARELAEFARRTLVQLGEEHPSLVHPLKTLGSLELAAERPDAAREALTRARLLHEANPGNSIEHAEVLWLLAQAERAAGDEAAARSRADAASTIYRQLGEPWTERAAQIDAWRERGTRQ